LCPAAELGVAAGAAELGVAAGAAELGVVVREADGEGCGPVPPPQAAMPRMSAAASIINAAMCFMVHLLC
jgi:hypothetical protein